ncbi:MAG: hypothetical protein AAGD32_12545 [Planctomycetota bacterium]
MTTGDSQGEAAALLKKLGLLAVVVVVFIGGFVGIKTFMGGEDLSKLHPKDRAAREHIDSYTTVEAREWLTGSKRTMLSGMTDYQAEHRIDQWYNMGAKTVYSFGGGMSMKVIFELPDDPAKREKLFAWRASWYAEMFEEALPDEGQQYMVVKLRL